MSFDHIQNQIDHEYNFTILTECIIYWNTSKQSCTKNQFFLILNFHKYFLIQYFWKVDFLKFFLSLEPWAIKFVVIFLT